MRAEKLLAPGARIGIIGGGQLGRMLAMAAAQLGFHVHIFSPEKNPPAAEVSEFHLQAEYDDFEALIEFARGVDVITYEFENVPAEPLSLLCDQTVLFPPVEALSVTQDRLEEKQYLQSLSIPVAPFMRVDSLEDLRRACETVGLPAMLKTRRFGYDGKGQAKIYGTDNLEEIYSEFASLPCIIETFISFECELSIVAVRSRGGFIDAYDVSRNIHSQQILQSSQVPAHIPEDISEAAYRIARVFADAIDYVGVFAVEFFYCGPEAKNPLVVNEIAPRVHNTGHWTSDACVVSQFENHIRAIAGWPIGKAMRHSDAEMINLIGEDISRWIKYASDPDVAVHLYGKEEVREGRKMGHITKLKPKT